MNFKSTWFSFFSLIVASGIVFFLACHKQNANSGNVSTSAAIIAKAKQYFELNVQSVMQPANAQSENPRAGLHKTPIWAMAYTVPITTGGAYNVVVVPVTIKENLYLKRNGGNFTISAGLLTYLVIYPDSIGVYHAEVITKIPDDSYVVNPSTRASYTGMIRVEDWQGNFVKGYHYTNGAVDRLLGFSAMRQDDTNIKSPASVEWDCTITDWYNCYSTDGGLTYSCSYDYEEDDCVDGGGPSGSADIYQNLYKYLPGGYTGTWTGVGGGPGPLCQDFSFNTDANGNYVANLNGLGVEWTNSVQGNLLITYPNTCITIPSSGITQEDASSRLAAAWNYGIETVLGELNNGTLSPENAASALATETSNRFSFSTPGASWDAYENCSESAPNNTYSICQP